MVGFNWRVDLILGGIALCCQGFLFQLNSSLMFIVVLRKIDLVFQRRKQITWSMFCWAQIMNIHYNSTGENSLVPYLSVQYIVLWNIWWNIRLNIYIQFLLKYISWKIQDLLEKFSNSNGHLEIHLQRQQAKPQIIFSIKKSLYRIGKNSIHPFQRIITSPTISEVEGFCKARMRDGFNHSEVGYRENKTIQVTEIELLRGSGI